MSKVIWSNKIKGNNLCLYCANYFKKGFFCTDLEDSEPVIVCKYYLPLNASEMDRDLMLFELLNDML